jgi:hypothetical protein
MIILCVGTSTRERILPGGVPVKLATLVPVLEQ